MKDIQKEVSKILNVIVNEKQIIDMFDMCGIEELEIIISLLKKRIERMLQKTIDVIELYENDNELKKFRKAIESQYETKERIEKLLK